MNTDPRVNNNDRFLAFSNLQQKLKGCFMKTKHTVRVRWLIRKDMPMINEINMEANYQLLEEDIVALMRSRNVTGMVIDLDDVVAGYMIYGLNRSSIELLHMVVDPVFTGLGLGRVMLEKLKSKLIENRTSVYTTVSEYNVQAQVFLRACGFGVVKTLKDWDENGDGYIFEHVRMT